MMHRSTPKQNEASSKMLRHLAGIGTERSTEARPYRGGEKCFAPRARPQARPQCHARGPAALRLEASLRRPLAPPRPTEGTGEGRGKELSHCVHEIATKTHSLLGDRSSSIEHRKIAIRARSRGDGRNRIHEPVCSAGKLHFRHALNAIARAYGPIPGPNTGVDRRENAAPLFANGLTGTARQIAIRSPLMRFALSVAPGTAEPRQTNPATPWTRQRLIHRQSSNCMRHAARRYLTPDLLENLGFGMFRCLSKWKGKKKRPGVGAGWPPRSPRVRLSTSPLFFAPVPPISCPTSSYKLLMVTDHAAQ